TIKNMNAGYGKMEILHNFDLFVSKAQSLCLIGPNGAGKSTLMKLIAGQLEPDEGSRWIAPSAQIAYLPQSPQFKGSMSLSSYVLQGLDETSDLATAERIRQSHRAEAMLDKMGMDPARMTDGLSGGERRRASLARALITDPQVLLLDEPTNHLDAESVAWLQRFLHDFPGTVVTITHDRYFLDEVAGWILELDRGAGIPYQGNYSGWLEQKQKRLEQEGKAEDSRVKSLSRELEWVRSAPKARQSKSKARLSAYEKLLEQDKEARNETTKISIPAGPRLGDIVIEADKLEKGFGDKLLIEDLSFR
ncbi:MAG: ATP-binding cassette domain-containing protein, partial [Candidatus Puniceispirillaceae bacterium]